jgi:hypothetical protein
VYECKQNGEDFFSSLAVTYSRFGNCPANGLVTEQPQYSVAVCIFSTLQNTEISLIPNGLCLIFTYSLLLALLYTFHSFRHTFATLQVELGTDIYTVQNMLGHANVTTTEIYARHADEKSKEASLKISLKKCFTGHENNRK